MTFQSAFKTCMAAASACVLASLFACGGGGGNSGGAASSAAAGAASGGAATATPASTPTTTSTASNVLRLSTAVQSQPVAKDAAASAILASVGVAGLYMSAARPFFAATLAGAPATTTNCAKAGTYSTVVSNVAAPGLRAGETATVSFNQCVGEVAVSALSSGSSISGSVSFQVTAVQGIVGVRTANWSYTATETANALAITSSSATTTFNGAVTFTVSYNAAAGSTTTTASTPGMTIGRTQVSASGVTIDGTLTATALSWTDVYEAASATETLSATCAVSVVANGVTLAFDLATPVPLNLVNDAITAGTLQLTTADTTETVVAQNASTFGITVTSGGSTGVWTESASALAS
jgi:hypothetical protein